MPCKCREELEEKLLKHFKEQNQDAKEHEATLKGYVFTFGKRTYMNRTYMKGAMPIELTAEFPLKKGEFRRKTEKQSMLFSYCPFCGKKYDEVE